MAEPLFLEPVMQEKMWGGDRLQAAFGYDLPSEKIGECWAISAHPNGVSVIKNGRYAGVGLDRLYQERRDLFGQDISPVFPVLTKILDANDWLSVQVHPDDAYAMQHEGELGKTECWYVLAADEGAEIIYGHKAQSKEDLSRLIKEEKWQDLLMRVPVRVGDFFYVPSGTVHAIGKGILILETQQSSDTTYRLYDFDRKDETGKSRTLHINQSIDVTRIDPVTTSHPDTVRIGSLCLTTFVSNDFFTVYKWQLRGAVTMEKTAPYSLVSVIDGKGELRVDGETYLLQKGDHFILPSDVALWELEGNLDMIVSHH